MKRLLPLIALLVTPLIFAQGVKMRPDRIQLKMEPYISTEGPTLDVGTYSDGLEQKDEQAFLGTIGEMKAHWDELSAIQIYAAAVRLYNEGYRDASVEWFYAGQLRSRLLNAMIDTEALPEKSLGDETFQMLKAHRAFYEVVGPFINGYAFGDIDQLIETLKQVKTSAPDAAAVAKIYSDLPLIPEEERAQRIQDVLDGMDAFIQQVDQNREVIRQQREKTGEDKKFDLSSKALPDGI